MSLLELFLGMPLPAQIIALIYVISIACVLLIAFDLWNAPVIEDEAGDQESLGFEDRRKA